MSRLEYIVTPANYKFCYNREREREKKGKAWWEKKVREVVVSYRQAKIQVYKNKSLSLNNLEKETNFLIGFNIYTYDRRIPVILLPFWRTEFNHLRSCVGDHRLKGRNNNNNNKIKITIVISVYKFRRVSHQHATNLYPYSHYTEIAIFSQTLTVKGEISSLARDT